MRTRLILRPARDVIPPLVPGFEAISWFGLMAPAGTSTQITGKVYKQAVQIAAMDHLREKLAQLGLEPVGDPPAVFGAIIKTDIGKSAEVIRAAGIKAD
jgi:tripartite-type tricarboxylate transporter receptor subunit TctC